MNHLRAEILRPFPAEIDFVAKCLCCFPSCVDCTRRDAIYSCPSFICRPRSRDCGYRFAGVSNAVARATLSNVRLLVDQSPPSVRVHSKQPAKLRVQVRRIAIVSNPCVLDRPDLADDLAGAEEAGSDVTGHRVTIDVNVGRMTNLLMRRFLMTGCLSAKNSRLAFHRTLDSRQSV